MNVDTAATASAGRRACCAGLAARPADPAAAVDLSGAFKALGDPHRVTIVQILAAAEGPVCVCDLEEHLPLRQPTVSHHLRTLVDTGFLEREQVGRWAYYRLRPERVRQVAGALDALR